MGTESKGSGRVEYQRTLLGVFPLTGWTPLGEGLFIHTEEMSHAVGIKAPRIITSIRKGAGYLPVLTELRYNPETKVHETHTMAFSREDIEDLNTLVNIGLCPRQFRWGS